MMSVTSPECPCCGAPVDHHYELENNYSEITFLKHAKKCVNMHNRLLAALKRTVDMNDADFEGTIEEIKSLIAEAEAE